MENKRESFIERNTKETQIKMNLTVGLKASGSFDGTTGIGFFDHMLSALCVHGGIDMKLCMNGDLNVDGHHSVEDVGIVFGTALKEAAGDKNSLTRFGSAYIPMDESLSFCAVDFSGRPYLVFDCDFTNQYAGMFDLCLAKEFFYAVSYSAGITLHLRNIYGENDHHKIESLFKAFAHACRAALEKKEGGAPSSKGVIADL